MSYKAGQTKPSLASLYANVQNNDTNVWSSSEFKIQINLGGPVSG